MAAGTVTPPESAMSVGTPGGATLPRPSLSSDVCSLVQTLQQAIRFGDEEQAKKLATQLAKRKAAVSVDMCFEKPVHSGLDQDIRVKVYVEDKDSSGVCVVLKLKPSMTIRQLKSKMLIEYSFPPEVQKWIVGKRIAADDDTLAKCGVKSTGSIMYLYLISPKSVGLSKNKIMQKYRHLLPADSPLLQNQLASQQNPEHAHGDSRQSVEITEQSKVTISAAGDAARPIEGATSQREVLPGITSTGTAAGGNKRVKTPVDITAEKQQIGWECVACTFFNVPTRPGCEICGHPRPSEYEVPVGYVIPQVEMDRITAEQEAERLAREHADRQENDDENDGMPPLDPVQQQQRIGGTDHTHLQMSEKQLDKLLRLNDLFNAGVIGDSNENDLRLLKSLEDKETADPNEHMETPVQGAPIYQPDLPAFVSGVNHSSLPRGGLDHSDFGRNATEGLLTDHTDYALLEPSHSPDWDMYSSLTNAQQNDRN